jgi:hypothetical protein
MSKKKPLIDTSKLNQIDTYTYPEYDRANIAVKIVDDRGIESLKVIPIGGTTVVICIFSP